MLRQEEVAFIKAVYTLKLSPALLKELRMALSSRRKKSAASAGSRSTSLRGGLKVSLQAFSQQAGKRKPNELASSGDTMEPANRRPTPGAGSVLLPSILSVMGEQTAVGSRQPATRASRGRGDVRGSTGRARRTATAKWVAQAHSHGFGPVRIR